MLISKFPGYVREGWNIKIPCIRRTNKKDPKFFGLPRFVGEESMLVNDPLFYKEQLKSRKFLRSRNMFRWQNIRNKTRWQKGVTCGVNSYAAEMLEKQNKKEASCHFCETEHKLDEWEEIREECSEE